MPATARQNPTLGKDEVLSAITSLRLIFWGGLLCVFEYPPARVDGAVGWRIDLFNDLLGAILIAAGVLRLARLPVHPPWNDHYGATMKFVRSIALLGVPLAAMGQVVFRQPPLLAISLAGFRIVQVGAAVLLCLSMRWLCAAAGLASVRRAWDITTGAFVCLWLVPLGGTFYLDFLSLMANKPPTREFGAFRYALQAILVAPLVVLYVSATLTAKRALEEARDGKSRAGPGDLPPGESSGDRGEAVKR